MKKKGLFFIYFLCFFSGMMIGNFYKPEISKKIEQIIEREAKAFALDSDLVKAITLIESSGFEKAISRKGARGMMQLMPDTAKQMAKELNMVLEPDSLLLPEINIRLGCYYLYQLLRKFQGDLVAVLAGYNTGPFRVAEWLSQHQEASTMQILEAKASPQTRIFVKRVLLYYQKEKNK